jgi:DNA/RNA endonuclease G (NUC1)
MNINKTNTNKKTKTKKHVYSQSYKKNKSKSKPLSKKLIKLHSLKLHKIKFNNDSDSKNSTYKSVFINNKNLNKDIVFLNKQSFDIFYSKKYKYPLLVRELLTKLTGIGETKIIRSDLPDPWINDTSIPLKHSLTLNDYKTYEYYGGSAGHNAPAGWHKFDMNDYKDTFNLTNITPQTYSLNTGYWNILEYFCKQLQHNKDLSNVNIFTGSIINTKNSLMYNAKLEETSINIPTYMFKIVCFNHLNYPNITFLDIFIFNNKFYKLNLNKKNINFTNYLLPIKSYNWFENSSGINILNLLQFYNIDNHNIKSFKTIINLNLHMNLKNKLELYIKTSYFISSLYDVSTLEELYTNYNVFQTKVYENIDDNPWISNIFCKVRNKLIRDAILYKNFKNLNQFNNFFFKLQNDLNTKFYINKEKEITYLDISQDEYLNNYYTIILHKNNWKNK